MLIKEEDRKVLKDVFEKELMEPVTLVMFTQKKSALIVPDTVTVPCEWCEQTEIMVQEVAELSDKITAEIHDFVAEAEVAKQYGVDKIPAIAVVGEKDYGIRLYGIPAGYEFGSLIEAIIDVSKRNTILSAATKERLKAIDKDVHIQVFITPT